MSMKNGGNWSMGRPVLAGMIGLMLAIPAGAQFSDSYNFLKAVRDKDGEKVMQSLEGNKSTLINTKDYTTGESAIHIVTKRRDDQWMRFLLAKGANPDLRDAAGNSALMIAAQLGFLEGEAALIESGANINLSNASGETPIIAAVQHRDMASVRLLLANGADASIRDHLAGMSAKDYAEHDTRAAAILKMINDTPKPKPAVAKQVAGPGL